MSPGSRAVVLNVKVSFVIIKSSQVWLYKLMRCQNERAIRENKH